MGGDGGDGWANTSEEGNWDHGMEEYDDEEEEDGYEFVGAEDAMQCVEMAERRTAARAHNYEELATRKSKALTEEQPHRCQISLLEQFQQLPFSIPNTWLLRWHYPWWIARRLHLPPTLLRSSGCNMVVFQHKDIFNTSDCSQSSSREESSKRPRKDNLSEAEAATMFDQLMEGFGLRRRKRSKEIWKKDDAPLARYCILKAMRADPEDTGLKYVGTDIYRKLHDYQKAAVIYEQIVKVDPANVFVRKVAAQVFLENVHLEPSKDNIDVIKELAETFENMGQYEYAVKFYLMIENVAGHNDCTSYVKIAQCYMILGKKREVVPYFYKALQSMTDNIDIRITLSLLLIDEDKTDEAVALLSPPKSSEFQFYNTPDLQKPWWHDGKVKMQLAKIYYDTGKLEKFVDTIFLTVLETLNIEHENQKVHTFFHVRSKNKPTDKELHERVKVLGEQDPNIIFQGIRPIASPGELQMANRAKKMIEKRAALNEDIKPDDLRRTKQVLPVPDLLTNIENHQLVLNLCRTLALLQRYQEALQIINHTLNLGNGLSVEYKEELRSLGAQITYRAPDLRQGFKYVRYVVEQHPYSLSAWNSFYKVTSRIEDISLKKFIRRIRKEKADCVPPIIISGHRFTDLCQHQDAARDYLEAYKLEPENPLINLCVGTALINLALGFRLQNKNQCMVQGFAFLYKYLCLCANSQEALYNIARAYHHIGFTTLAAVYYEKALAIDVKDHHIPRLPYEAGSCAVQDLRPGYCNVRSEAAFNLHLIYKWSGATDLARRILRVYCAL
ncbi:hypothetical protein PR202_ga27527 [Eleusine coracana subsp. coracana]|uniref:General transcription factor 3C polypeptide 3 n=1 Tax=Eleusine coracana subsp. coracana TaxID=191504 RepID=A0AAV5DG65_ELECO|nr:hypothetical protein PR202_ga27527 [Eleusine coracana subsp. coracana]